MRATGILRPIDMLGRIVLPIELRRSLNIEEKDLVEIYVDGENIILKKHEGSCTFCKSTENLRQFSDKYVCADCADRLASGR